MNEIWHAGKFPEDWHKAVNIPILNLGKDKTEVTNYRLIVLTSCISKTMVRVIGLSDFWNQIIQFPRTRLIFVKTTVLTII